MGQIIRKFKLHGDKVIWIIIFLLSIISLLVVYSSTGTLAYKVRGGNTSFFFMKQFGLLLFCYVVIWVTHIIPYKYYNIWANMGLFVAIGMLLLAKFAGVNLNQASRWITIPVIGFNFQPSELAKLALILFVSRILSKFQADKECENEAFWKIMAAIGVVCGLIFLDDFSTSALLGVVCLMLMYIGRIAKKYLLGTMGAGLVLIVILLILAPFLPDSFGRIHTVRHRILNFAGIGDKKTDNDRNYQVDQAKIAVVSGGIFGKGPGNSNQRNFLPHPYSDFIYAIILEEWGWIGGFGILILYLFLIYRAGAIVQKCDKTFPAFLVIGLSISIVAQALTNMAVSVNLIPVTGQPLPLVSMGGTSLIFTSAALGMILSVSREVKEQEEQNHAEN
ncbi:FtsW/RodA/SpoVE family cell cycle protein [Ancylomarina sp. 16SWW S1-10-2]|uniref:FtsW/RodA/SpoVE family cell cycle protein n=1 Tax=Ancylomarina sp. 16SWW S1-10-2 TaxID=2499681 RepID=UPI0012AE6D78|nr:FtsW/RodA/SpoVE family cell cycle protein [Ancylomarina sp. 16SWW S1-10-2]MRT94191.1 hypothetical protein [Ancylomarina sp. 16SWW S1-10-2]